jgi:pantothenate kinase
VAPRRLSAGAWTDELVALAGRLPEGERRVVAIAGPPASGKSTLAETIEQAVNAQHPGRAAILPQDGFHFDDEVLIPRGWRARKGAPFTFDVGGLLTMVERLIRDTGEEIAVPRFDRSLEIARAGARIVTPDVRLLVMEGNYLLLDEAPWTRLAGVFDVTALIRVSDPELERRLLERWRTAGLDAQRLRLQVYENDLPNARLVMAGSRTPDVEITP